MLACRDRHGPLAWRGHNSASGVADPFPPASSPGALSPGAALSSLLSPRLFQHYPGFSSFTASDGFKSPASALRASVSARPGSAVWRGNADVGTIGFAAGPPPRPGAASPAVGHGSITVLQPAAQVQAMLALPHSLPGGMPGPARPARPNTAGPRSNSAGQGGFGFPVGQQPHARPGSAVASQPTPAWPSPAVAQQQQRQGEGPTAGSSPAAWGLQPSPRPSLPRPPPSLTLEGAGSPSLSPAGAGVPSRRQRPPSAGAWSRSLVRG